MAATWTIVPIPRWYFADNIGRPAGGAQLFTSYANNPSQSRAVASNPAGTTFYTNPILFDENGEAPGPFFFEDEGDGNDAGYFLRLLDADGDLLWTMNNFGPGIAGGGGGSIVTSAISIENQLTNGVFWRNAGTVTGSPSIPDLTKLAPGAHDGFGGGTVQTDIFYTRSASTCTETISFPTLFPNQPFQAEDDVTPVYALDYNCSVNVGGESFKYLYFPITANVQNLSNTDVKISLWGTSFTGANQITLLWSQHYGDGPGSAGNIITGIDTLILPTNPTWERFDVSSTVPDSSSNAPGECGNGALYLVVGLPINAAAHLQITKLCVYLGDNVPDGEFENFDHIASVIDAPRTGDVRISLNAFSPFGWVPANDGTIGSVASLATTRANVDTFPLYALLWNNVSDTYAPVSTGRGGSAVDDFVANKTIGLTKTLGRAIASVGTPSTGGTAWALGQFTGAETAALTDPTQLPPHNHPGSNQQCDNIGNVGVAQVLAVNQGISNIKTITNVTVATEGASAPFTIMQPTTFLNVFFKL